MTSTKQISIIGCGWLGLPLALAFQKEGYIVKGATTTAEKLPVLHQQGIVPYKVCATETGTEGDVTGFLEGSQTVIINIPPKLRRQPHHNHAVAIHHLIAAIRQSPVKQVLFVSSTSVFKDDFNMPIITKESTANNSTEVALQLIDIERQLQQSAHFKTTILRFSGLFGPNRHPGNYLSGKSGIANPEAPINLIHQQDAIAVIIALLEKKIWNITLNAAHPYHPSRKNYYQDYCNRQELPAPTFDYNQKSKGKIIDSADLEQLLGISLIQKP